MPKWFWIPIVIISYLEVMVGISFRWNRTKYDPIYHQVRELPYHEEAPSWDHDDISKCWVEIWCDDFV